MSQLSQLTKTALLGTQRTALPKTTFNTAVDRLLDDAGDANPEQTLLKMAGTLGLHEQVGRLPQRFTHLPDNATAVPEPALQRPVCSAALAERLTLMLEGQFRNLLPECLTALNKSGQRLPNHLLPDFLDRGKSAPLIRPYILPVLGWRGRWLAEQNPEWTYAALDVADWNYLIKHWRAAKPRARNALLRQLRHTHPQTARRLLVAIWKSEPSARRASYMALMDFGLSLDDEPFLEAALDDRDLQVRRKAARLLTNLPESRLCQRMQANVRHFLRYEPEQEHQIAVFFPPRISDQLARDGVNRDVGKHAARGRSRQLIQLIGAVPLDWWTESWQATPDEIIQAVQTSRWPRTITQGLTDAANRQKNVAWAMALLTQADFANAAARLIPVLPLEEYKTVVQRLDSEISGGSPLLKDSPLLKALRYWRQDWDEALALVWIDYLEHHIKQGEDDKPSPFLRTAVKNAAQTCPPQLADRVVQIFLPLTALRPGWRVVLNEIMTILTFRRDMYEEIEGQRQRD